MLNVANHARIQNIAPLFHYQPKPKIAVTSFSNELLHRSIIQYKVASERVRDLVSREFDLDTTTILTVESFLNQGRNNFEQTNYRLQAFKNERAVSWLLGTSLGSLSGVTARHLYATPWHLSAMELQVSYNSSSGKYNKYRISSQSQWANADWEIVDTGAPVAVKNPLETEDYFIRRDGQIGNYKTSFRPAFASQGKLKSGRCDMLQNLGILTAEEIQTPHSVTLQQAVNCEIQPMQKATEIMLVA